LLGRVTTHRPVLLYKGVLGEATVIVTDFPLFCLILLIGIRDILALVSPHLPFKLPLLPVLFRLLYASFKA
jgi:hypothetical protein